MHQDGPDPGALVLRPHPERPDAEGRDAERLEPPPGRDHVADDDLVLPRQAADGDQREVRQEADVAAQLVGQPGLDDLLLPVGGPAAEGRPVHRPDGVVISGFLPADVHRVRPRARSSPRS